MEAGVRGDLPRGEADVAHSHGERLAARWSAEEGLLGHLAEGSDDGHVDNWASTAKAKKGFFLFCFFF